MGRCIIYTAICIIYTISSCYSEETCTSPQYLGIGTTGTVQCSFEGFSSVHWYNTTDTKAAAPIVNLRDIGRDGAGYESGEFDISDDGSLIIISVGLRHEKTFVVNKFTSDSPLKPDIFNVDIRTTVTPTQRRPVVEMCANEGDVCFRRVTEDTRLLCHQFNSRPLIPLEWLVRTPKGERNTTYQFSNSSDKLLANSSASLYNVFAHSNYLALLVCRADNSLHLLEHNESVVFVQNRNISSVPTGKISDTHERGTKVEINCVEGRTFLVVWEKLNRENDFDTIAIRMSLHDEFSDEFDDDFRIAGDGALVIDKVMIQNEGLYRCIHTTAEEEEGVSWHEIKLKVDPQPKVLHVTGCNKDSYCTVDVTVEGNLTCAVKGIRPEVKLEWSAHQGSAGLVSFHDQASEKEKNADGTFDIAVTSQFLFDSDATDRPTVQCTVIGPNARLFPTFERRIDLFLTEDVTPTEEPIEDDTSWIIPVVVAVTIAILLAIVLTVICSKVSKRNTKNRNQDGTDTANNQMFEMDPLMPESAGDEDGADEKNLLISQLKGTYENWYQAVRPLPYVQDRTARSFSVESEFVEGGMECLVDQTKQDGNKWVSFESYRKINSDPRVMSTRRIIEGEPGYGKSTLTLKLVYEWCKGVENSLFQDTDIVILLRLRQLKGIPTIYDAIKRFLLPRDTTLQVENLELLLRGKKSVVIILDGYDEYPDIEDNKSFVYDIINRRMFQDIPVFLTTRSGNLPKEFAPQTKRLRLTGFNEKAQDRYLKKLIHDDDKGKARKIKDLLEDNPILGDLCQVPLFFVLYAHLRSENADLQKTTSVTKFFRYIVTTLIWHLKRKTLEDNVPSPTMTVEKENKELNKLAFDSLSSKSGDWESTELGQKIGDEFLEHYLQIGILREEEITEVSDTPGTPAGDHIKYIKRVRFYHKLFEEWYAAHHLAERVLDDIDGDEEIEQIVEDLDPNDLQYTYRFACGISPDASQRIIRCLNGVEGGDKFAILCIIEKCGHVDDIVDIASNICSKELQIAGKDTRLLQRSTQQLVEIASSRKIPISCLVLIECFKSVNQFGQITLRSEVCLLPLKSLRELAIEKRGKDLSADEVMAILKYASNCDEIKCVKFYYCMMPEKISFNHTMDILHVRNVKVSWYPTIGWFDLDVKAGKWQYATGRTPLTSAEYDKQVEKFHELYSTQGSSETD